MEVLCNFYGVSMVFYGVSNGVSMVVLWESPLGSKRVSMGFPLGSYEVPVVFLGILMGFLWDVHAITLGFL